MWCRPPDLLDEILMLAVEQAFLEDPWAVRDAAAFEACRSHGRPRLGQILAEIAALIGRILAQAHELRTRLAAIRQSTWASSVRDMREQLDRLVYRGFPAQEEISRLRQYPRYLQAMQMRLDKLAMAAARDQQFMLEMQGLQDEWLEREQQSRHRGGRDARLEEVRWMLEELRVSLFAQALKTAHPVSVKRIRKRWEDLGL